MIFDNYCDYVNTNKKVAYSVGFEKVQPSDILHKWVGGQCKGSCLYGIPNDMTAVLKYSGDTTTFLGEVGEGLFKWTGGCIWNGFLYAFPRSDDYLLKMNLERETVEYIPLVEVYGQEHHYGGICTKDGFVYQPPRDTNHILVWDLNSEKSRKIYLAPKGKTTRYCGSILLPDGSAFFLPEKGERVIKMNTHTEEWSYIGEPINAMVFDAKVSIDGRIYGYSAYCQGMIRIDPVTDDVRMVHQEIRPGAYGTKLGINGYLYSIPGDGDYVWEYNPVTDTLKDIYTLPSGFKAKYAGGATSRNGDIYGIPAKENHILRIKSNMVNANIPEDIYLAYFYDCY